MNSRTSLNSNPLELKGGIMNILPDDAPAPRLCHLIKWPDFDGYGFNLHAERSNPGQFIGKIDDDSPAQMAGLREGDRIVEVNGVNISNENHRQVVERIKSNPNETKLLVVDVEADQWYREQDFVVNSSQLNVIYIKTPIPRPQANSPRAKFHHHQQQQTFSVSPSTNGSSWLEATSDFNEDSIEHQSSQSQSVETATVAASEAADQQQQLQLKTPASTRASPPMSPDSGKGDEDSAAHSVTIEAEINRQSPVRPALDVGGAASAATGKISKSQQELEEKPEVVIKSALSEEAPPAETIKAAVGNMQPDSLGEPTPVATVEVAAVTATALASMSPSKQQSIAEQQDAETSSGQAIESQEGARKNSNCANRSTGSKSSSPETNSNCSSTSMASDSLEEHHHQQQQVVPQPPPLPTDLKMQKHHQQEPTADLKNNNLSDPKLNGDELQTIKSPLESSRASLTATTQTTATANNDSNNEAKTTTPIEMEAVSGEQQQLVAPTVEQPLKSNLATNSKINSREALQHNTKPPEEQLTSKQQQQQKKSLAAGNATTTANNNFSGLNLNMTASEMRELIARRKKFDPKKAQMNIRQKYEIIQQM